jgi:glycyl-tRNA synthetase beta chain
VKLDLVYEIGTEEIPAGYLPPAAEQLGREAESFFEASRIEPSSVETHATPRRLVLFAKGLPARQADRTEEVTGPPWQAAFTPAGEPTKAAEGFARGKGLRIEDLKKVETAKGPYVGATVQVEGKATADLLAAALPDITGRIAFPKTMRWGPARFRFARPIRWILALLADTVIPLEIEGVRAGRVTYGHRILSRGPFEVATAADYETALKKGLVILRSSDRARVITAALDEAASSVGGSVVPDPRLIDEVSFLVETPSVFVSDFDEEFLDLPAPVITTAMRDHQRYFALSGPDGALLPRFLCVSNSAPASVDQVQAGNRRVLRARLDDARFYWNEDQKTTLEEKYPSLGEVVWLEGFGTLQEKSERIGKLVAELARDTSPEVRETALRAAHLSKTELVTEMIKDGKEFTSLQGVMGREYALRNGEPAGVAQALEEQYRPRFAGDALPQSEAGALVAIADRIDTLVGVWSAGLKPTGSKDPFALRRGAIGVIRILLDRGMSRSLDDLVAKACESYGDRIEGPDRVVRETEEFIRDRLAGHLADEEGFDAGVVAAVVPCAGGNPLDARARAQALSELRSTRRDDFEALAAGFKRAKNILKQDRAEGRPSPDHLAEEAEKALYDAFMAVDEKVSEAERAHDYRSALADLARLRVPIDSFFDSVLVMSDDEDVRKNRLRLLGRIVDRIQNLADLSRIAVAEEKTG